MKCELCHFERSDTAHADYNLLSFLVQRSQYSFLKLKRKLQPYSNPPVSYSISRILQTVFCLVSCAGIG